MLIPCDEDIFAHVNTKHFVSPLLVTSVRDQRQDGYTNFMVSSTSGRMKQIAVENMLSAFRVKASLLIMWDIMIMSDLSQACHPSWHMEKLLKDNSTAIQAHPQKTITTFFSPITPTNATSQSRATQMGSWPGHNKGVQIYRTIAICGALDHDLIILVIDR